MAIKPIVRFSRKIFASVSSAGNAITQDFASAMTSTTASSTSYSHAQGSLVNGYVVVGVAWRGSNTISSLTYGGTAMTLLASYSYNTSNSSIYGLALGTSSGSQTVAITFSASTSFDIGSVTFSNVHQAGGFSTVSYHNAFTNNIGSGTIATTSTNQVVISIAEGDPQTGGTITPQGNVNTYWSESTLLIAAFGWAQGAVGNTPMVWGTTSINYCTAAIVVLTPAP